MSRLLRVSLTVGALCVLTETRILPGMTSFEKELKFQEKQIILGKPFITEYESFVYAICAPQQKTFDEKHCNVTIETPAFTNATYKDTCSVSFVPDNPNLETLSKLELYSYGDDKVVFSWLIRDRDYHPKSSRVRILKVATCKSIDVPIPSQDIDYIITYGNTFDVVLTNKTFCGNTSCRQTYDAEGKKLAGSSPILYDLKYHSHESIGPRIQDKSYFAIVGMDNDKTLNRVYKVAADGKGTEMSSFSKNVPRVSFSKSFDFFGVCTIEANTKVNCRQYDAKVNIKMNANLEFKDEPLGIRRYVRWLQTHNLQEGGMLIITGSASGPEANRFDEFSVMKLHQDGSRDRPLEVDGLNFECTRIESLRVAVTENNIDEFCFHFVCKRQVFDQDYVTNNVKFATKCMPRVYLTLPKRRPSVISY